eukprot:1157849-Pelagomonas_calceolata.AAC.12
MLRWTAVVCSRSGTPPHAHAHMPKITHTHTHLKQAREPRQRRLHPPARALDEQVHCLLHCTSTAAAGAGAAAALAVGLVVWQGTPGVLDEDVRGHLRGHVQQQGTDGTLCGTVGTQACRRMYKPAGGGVRAGIVGYRKGAGHGHVGACTSLQEV